MLQRRAFAVAEGTLAIDVQQLYARQGPMVLRRCRHLLRDEALAADAMHDVFVQVLNHRARLEDRGLSSLLYRIATHVCLNRLRTRRRRPEVPLGDRSSDEDDLLNKIAALDDTEGQTLAAAALDQLFGRHPESTRTLAVLHLLDGLTLEEVAAEVGLSVSGVRKRLRTLRAHLHELEGV